MPERETLTLDGAEVYRHDYSMLFGDMDAQAFDNLVKNIETHGLENPRILMTEDGGVLDGWHRCRALSKLGLESQLDPEVVDLSDQQATIRTVAKLNLHRRHLTPGQRALAMVRLTSAYSSEFGTVDWTMSIADTAAAIDVSEKTVQNVRRKETERLTGVSTETATDPEDVPMLKHDDVVKSAQDKVDAIVDAAEKGAIKPKPPKGKQPKQEELDVEMSPLDIARAENEKLKDTIAVMAKEPTKADQARIDALSTIRSQRDHWMGRYNTAVAEVRSLRASNKKLEAAARSAESSATKAKDAATKAKDEAKELRTRNKQLDKQVEEGRQSAARIKLLEKELRAANRKLLKSEKEPAGELALPKKAQVARKGKSRAAAEQAIIDAAS